MSPVLGFLPFRDLLSLTWNFPKLLISKLLPAISDDLDNDKNVSTDLAACGLDIP